VFANAPCDHFQGHFAHEYQIEGVLSVFLSKSGVCFINPFVVTVKEEQSRTGKHADDDEQREDSPFNKPKAVVPEPGLHRDAIEADWFNLFD